MDLQEFRTSLSDNEPPPGLSPQLNALWYARNHDWELAHQLVQDDAALESAWVHAFLHREEGDYANAGYWYAKAKRPAVPKAASLDDEWVEIVEELLSRVN